MSKEWDDYVSDPRTICKYGIKCYQKNTEHHTMYKHPPKPQNLKGRGNRNKRFNPYRRDTPSPQANTDAESSGSSTNRDNVPSTDNDHVIDTNTKDEPAVRSDDEEVLSKLDQTQVTKASEPVFKGDNKPTSSTNTESPKKEESKTTEQTFYDPTNHELLQELFLIDMPTDFFKFFESLNENNDIVKLLSSVNLELIGPYDLLLGKLPVVIDKDLYLVHWRFFYDPPEFQSVLKRKGKSEYHIGYFRDDPKEKPVFLASNDCNKDYHFKPMSENIFGAVYMYLKNEKKTSPFISVACQKLMDKVKKYAESNNFSLEEFNMKRRQAKIVTKTFHGAGIVVPYNKKTQLGYRHLVENDVKIKKMFTQLQAATSQKEKDNILSDLQPVITYASIAMDECDFGTGLEAGIALFCSGIKELEQSALSSLTTAYSLLNRDAFGKIIQAHLKFRRKGPNMSLLAIVDE